jgi:hypothetical protein
MSRYYAYHKSVRNDYDKPIDLWVGFAETFDDAYDMIYSRHKWYFESNLCDPLEFKELLETKTVWIWEWRRRGNGDQFKIDVCSPETTELDVVNMLISRDDSVTFDD